MRISDWSSDVCSSDLFHSAELPLRHAMGDEPVVKNLAGLLMDGEAAGAWSIMDPLYVAVIMFHGLHGAVDEAIVAENVDKPIGPMIADLYIRSEEHTSELQSLMRISYAVFCLKKNNIE